MKERLEQLKALFSDDVSEMELLSVVSTCLLVAMATDEQYANALAMVKEIQAS